MGRNSKYNKNKNKNMQHKQSNGPSREWSQTLTTDSLMVLGVLAACQGASVPELMKCLGEEKREVKAALNLLRSRKLVGRDGKQWSIHQTNFPYGVPVPVIDTDADSDDDYEGVDDARAGGGARPVVWSNARWVPTPPQSHHAGAHPIGCKK